VTLRFTAALVALLTLAAAPTGNQAATPEPIDIPVVVSLTGVAAFVGKNEAQALQIAEKMVNAQGGINQRPLHFDISDDESSGQVALQLVNGLPAGSPLLLGPGLTQDCNAVAPIVRDAGPAQWCLGPGINPPAGGYVFASSVSLYDSAKVILRFFHQRGLNRIALLLSTDATAQEADRVYELARNLPEFHDVDFVAREHFNLSDLSVAAQISRIKAARPQALLTYTLGAPFATLLRGLKDAGLDIPVSASSANMVYEQLEQYTGIMPKELLFATVLSATPDAVGKGPAHDAGNAYRAAFKAAGVRPSGMHALAWDPALIAVDAYRHLGPKLTALQFRNYVLNLHGWTGINGVYDFRDGSQRGIGANASIVAAWDPVKHDFVTVSRRGGFVK
jgi:branched-chain amino acid transport system substrate-binding protein